MKIIVCVDDKNGMAFNNRRQSKDRELIKYLCGLVKDCKVRMTEYSKILFPDEFYENIILASENVCDGAENTDYCFMELNNDVLPYKDMITEIILIKWNRAYPSDIKFPLIHEINPNLKLKKVIELIGSSHEHITLEIYKNAQNK